MSSYRQFARLCQHVNSRRLNKQWPSVERCWRTIPSMCQPVTSINLSRPLSSITTDVNTKDLEQLDQVNLIQDVLNYNTSNNFDLPLDQRNVVVIMPRQKNGPEKKTKEQGQFLLEETVTLVQSISGWHVVGSEMISTSHIHARAIFGRTNLEHIKQYVRYLKANTVVFSVDVLRPVQHHYLQNQLGVEVYDRFNAVLKIFRQKAATKETKLQLALAELNYVKKNLHHMKESEFNEFSLSKSFGGNFDTFYQVKKQLLQEKEIKLKKMLEKVEKNYEIKKHNRMNLEIPTVAVIGYTNSGKTSLIKALTQSEKLVPEDKLFATLDVSVHQVNLPSNLKALLLDTIGFISEIPTTLIHCFKSTLNEICTADLLVHVCDSSHPDRQTQVDTVKQTLADINVPSKLIYTMIEVSNKVDKVDDLSTLDQSFLPISTTERIGLHELKSTIETRLIDNTDRLMFDIRVPSGGEQYQWLYSETSIVDCKPDDEDSNFMIMKIIVTKSKLGRFMKFFKKKSK